MKFAKLNKLREESVLLTLFKLRVLLVNDVEAAFSAYQFAVDASFLNGCSDFHMLRFSMLDPPFFLPRIPDEPLNSYLYLYEILPLVKS